MPLQIPQLDDRNFEQLVAEARARIPVHTPEWTNFNDSDPGITIVQLFAFMTENLLYRSNRIPEASRKKFLTLLGVPLRQAAPGRGLITFLNDRGPLQALPLDAGVEVRAGKVPFRTRTSVCVLPVQAAAFYKKPQSLSAEERQQYDILYQTFLEDSADQLILYKTTPLDPPEVGKPLPAIDLADSLGGTVDGALWIALLGARGVDPDDVRAAIAGQTLTLGIYPDDRCPGRTLQAETFVGHEVADPGLVFEVLVPDLKAGSEYVPATYKALELVYAENVLDGPGVVQLRLPSYSELARLGALDFDPEEEGTGDYPPLIEDRELADRIAAWLRIRLARPENKAATGSAAVQQARLSWVGANAARVIQALPLVNERLGIGTGAPEQMLRVSNTPVIAEAQADETAPLSSMVLEVERDGGWDEWRQTDDLYAAGPDDPVYTLDPESGEVRCGDGLRGKRWPLGRVVRASYEYGGGPEGMVPIKAISKSAALPGGFKVENPLRTWGADAGESTADGERNITRYLRHRDRLVTASDFRDIALRAPGVEIGRVEVLSLFNPDAFTPSAPQQTFPGTVTLLAIPRNDPEQPEAPRSNRLFLNAICDWLDPRRLITTEVYVRGPEYVPIYVSVGIVTQPGRMRELVAGDVRAALRAYLSPLTGGPPVPGAQAPDPCAEGLAVSDPCAPPQGIGWPLGVEVRRQDLEATATRVPGVRYVTAIRMGVLGSDGTTLTDVERVPLAGLQLPYLVGVNVSEGEPEDLAVLLGQKPAGPAKKLRAVPALPKKC